MGLYDPEFNRKPFNMPTRAGEVPGSIVLGKSGNKGCIWPGQGGKWFAAKPGHPADEPYRCFETKEGALEHVTAPLRHLHEQNEDYRESTWKAAAPKRAARAERSKAREAKRVDRKRKKGEKVWRVIDSDRNEIGRVARVMKHEAIVAAASLLGFSVLPKGYDVEPVD